MMLFLPRGRPSPASSVRNTAALFEAAAKAKETERSQQLTPKNNRLCTVGADKPPQGMR
jgi:hypothetical protein